MRSLPNFISLLRLILAPYVFLLAHRGEDKGSALLFLVLALSDALDGAIARFYGAQTTLGKFLDPLADKVLLFFGLLSITTSTSIRANPLLFQALISRDLFLVVGTLLLRRFGFVPEPSVLGKLTTLSLSITVFLGFAVNLHANNILLGSFEWFQFLSLALVVASGIDYGVRGVNFLLSKLIIERR